MHKLGDIARYKISSYQRPISATRVRKIAARFDPAKLGVLVVSRREDGTYAILDGQHRLSALRVMGVKRGLAIVLEGMTLEREADYFRHQNENTTTLNCYDLYNAGIVARDAHYLTIDRILSNHGFSASRKSGPLQVTAVSALSRIVVLFGFEVLDRVFAYISATWATDSAVIRREMLAGLADFVTRFGKSVTPEQFSARMLAVVMFATVMAASVAWISSASKNPTLSFAGDTEPSRIASSSTAPSASDFAVTAPPASSCASMESHASFVPALIPPGTCHLAMGRALARNFTDPSSIFSARPVKQLNSMRRTSQRVSIISSGCLFTQNAADHGVMTGTYTL